jgi:ribosomal protein S18 acetylase RimI-like enzyme
VRVRRAGAGDEAEIVRFEAAFDFAVRPDETRRFLEDDRHHLILGYLDERPAGFVSAVEIFHPDKRPELFLNEIGVAEDARRRGVARTLIEELKALGRERGCAAIWVLTDEGNEAAMALYRGTGGQWDGDQTVMFEYEL